jgi:5-(carboxyamino)imidazole ribonucleotide synthase
LDRFAAGLDVVTFEIVHLPIATVRRLETQTVVRPTAATLDLTGDRLRQKRFLNDQGIAVAAFAAIDNAENLLQTTDALGLPLVAKTRTHGYDGRGQVVIRSRSEAFAAWAALGARPLVAEAFVPFERELSVVAVRSARGDIRCYAAGQNHHLDGILQWTIAPAPDLDDPLQRQTREIACQIAEALDYVGVLTVELFQVGKTLLVNEVAARVHNSGHWTIEGAETSQFENHLRAIVGWPLGSTASFGNTVLVNLIGRHPDVARLLELPDTHVHLYDKHPKPLRKIGHITSRVRDAGDVRQRLHTITELV